MSDTLLTQYTKPSWERVMDSILPGRSGWQEFISNKGNCLETCPSFKSCKGNGPNGLCSTKWREVPCTEDVVETIFHILNHFDYYNQNDLPKLTEYSPVVRAMRAHTKDLGENLANGFLEGGKKLRLHYRRERSSAASKRLKARAVDSGHVVCASCKIDFFPQFGALSSVIVECHHTIPISSAEHSGITRLQDLILLCANCHRLIHSGKVNLSLKKLRKLVTANPTLKRDCAKARSPLDIMY